jgi:hypothetical protein
MTLLILWLLLHLSGLTHPALYVGAAALWIGHLIWHSTTTNKLF